MIIFGGRVPLPTRLTYGVSSSNDPAWKFTARFKDTYYLTGDMLGEGSYGRVETCINMFTDLEYAVKLIAKSDWCFSRAKVLKVGNGRVWLRRDSNHL